MKKLILISTVLFLTQINFVNGQCIADAGPDVIICGDWYGMDSVQLGGNPTAIGGTPPYTYIWETTWQVGTWIYTASDFLDDTTSANPTVISSGENLIFKLTVIDSKSNICTDSVNVRFSIFGTHLGTCNYVIQHGDSVFLSNFHNVLGGISPVNYLWRPNHGLSDSTSLSFWAKPDSSVAYYLTATDSAGCSATGAPVYFVTVKPVSINDQEIGQLVNLYPNPSTDQITICFNVKKPEIKIIEFYNNKGQVIHRLRTNEETIKLNTTVLSKGLNFYKIYTSEELLGHGKFIVK